MEFEIFKANLEILDKAESSMLRKKYIEKFVNDKYELFQEQISIRHKFVDGDCYLGYLWDYVKNPVIIQEAYFEDMAAGVNEVYVFWDIHSCERILIEDYWKFDKDVVLKIDFQTLLKGEKYLPEDIYIFDDTFTWTLIKTHEEIDGKSYYLKSGEIKND